MKKLSVLSAVACLLGGVSTASAGELNIGDLAPALQVTQWVKGDPVDLQQTTGHQIVVVEFWATWCGPCIESIPELSAIQREFQGKGVTVVGFSAYDDGNTQDMVEKFTRKQGDKIGYRIAFEKERTTYDSYMTAAGENGIPTAFVINKEGRIAWIGHPEGNLHGVLKQIIAGTYNIEVAAKDHTLRKQTNEAWMNQEWNKVVELADQRIELRPDHFGPYLTKFEVYSNQLNDPVKALASAQKAVDLVQDDADELSSTAGKLVRKEDPHGFNKLALSAIERAVKLDPDNADVNMSYYKVLATLNRDDEAIAVATRTVGLIKGDGSQLGHFAGMLASPDAPTRCHDLAMKTVEMAIAAEPDQPKYLQTKFNILVTCKDDLRNANIVGRYMVEQASDDAGLLNNFAWDLLTREEYKTKFNELALVASDRCHNASGGTNWMYLDTYALANFENGKVDDAIELETKALELCPEDHPGRAEVQDALKRFEESKKK